MPATVEGGKKIRLWVAGPRGERMLPMTALPVGLMRALATAAVVGQDLGSLGSPPDAGRRFRLVCRAQLLGLAIGR